MAETTTTTPAPTMMGPNDLADALLARAQEVITWALRDEYDRAREAFLAAQARMNAAGERKLRILRAKSVEEAEAILAEPDEDLFTPPPPPPPPPAPKKPAPPKKRPPAKAKRAPASAKKPAPAAPKAAAVDEEETEDVPGQHPSGDPNVNVNGVYVHGVKEIELPIPASKRASVRLDVAQGADGRYRVASHVTWDSESGSGSPVRIEDPSYPTEDDALLAEARYIADQFRKLLDIPNISKGKQESHRAGLKAVEEFIDALSPAEPPAIPPEEQAEGPVLAATAEGPVNLLDDPNVNGKGEYVSGVTHRLVSQGGPGRTKIDIRVARGTDGLYRTGWEVSFPGTQVWAADDERPVRVTATGYESEPYAVHMAALALLAHIQKLPGAEPGGRWSPEQARVYSSAIKALGEFAKRMEQPQQPEDAQTGEAA